ncbi:GNAT family N-acetyltransferase [Streptacidiphilus carbonis]|jgi:RimJ/RimL family protein N-acetyltransferase|uniref:GNAT family N-acetyltransferase n=1 Tax=Streptacidiphilus carbonis TaxID=105422 RepID=UPI0005AACC12|nr:GNAT family N-acetyltransferase [Streptacidiphilus carbonis]
MSTSAYEPMPSALETERLLLRPWVESDAEQLLALHAERAEGVRPGVATVAEARANIAAQLLATAKNGLALLSIRRRDEGDLIGYCGLVVGRSTVDEPEIAYELFPRVHGHGYATEAAAAVLAAATATGRKRVWATVGTWNAPSLRVLEKLGFERDHLSMEDSGEVVWLTREPGDRDAS